MPAISIPPQPWMHAPETRRLLDALTAGGTEVRFVGGCVRDAVAGRPVVDIDLATADPPERVTALLKTAGLGAVPTGIAHGTVTAVVDGRPFEVTTLRRDVETFGRHARVAFTDDWQADAARRDFTMNAMSCRSDGTLFDPFDGIRDLRAGRVRFVGDARRRIAEDVLRLLRFFRFHAWYGRPPADPAALAACREAAPLLAGLSAERVRKELLRLLEAPDPLPAIRLMADEGILSHLLPRSICLGSLAELVRMERAVGEADAVRRLAVLVRIAPDKVAALAAELRLSSAERKRLFDIARYRSEATGGGDLGDNLGGDVARMRRRLYRDGGERYRDYAYVAAADGMPNASELLPRRLAEAARWEAPALPVDGRDVAALGIPPGPAVGRLLAEIGDWWLERDFLPDRAACLDRLRQAAETLRGSRQA